eukprot:1147238-Pelagomonas_calceolata.AAC.2
MSSSSWSGGLHVWTGTFDNNCAVKVRIDSLDAGGGLSKRGKAAVCIGGRGCRAFRSLPTACCLSRMNIAGTRNWRKLALKDAEGLMMQHGLMIQGLLMQLGPMMQGLMMRHELMIQRGPPIATPALCVCMCVAKPVTQAGEKLLPISLPPRRVAQPHK